MRAWLVDAFTSKPLAGGPAYVLEPFDVWPETLLLQKLAREFGQPETAFLRQIGHRFEIRWFTPTHEVPLCGHATLAATHVLIGELGYSSSHIDFTYGGGRLSARLNEDGYELDFPADDPRRVTPPKGLQEVFDGLEFETWAGDLYLCARLMNEEHVRAFRPERGILEKVSTDHGCEPGSLIITSLAEEGKPYDAVSRFFAPLFGIPEDPVTGSAHCMLMPLYAQLTGKTCLHFHQAYPGRGGDLRCELKGDRVILRGQARTTVRATVQWDALVKQAMD